ncbi:MAG: DNA primase [Rhodobacteraceae bacterium]|nr:DNA primase [Paracoccaceae bacterium]
MSLPDGFLDDLRTRLSIADVVGRKVMWDARKTNAGKGDYWAPCPFHQEKTASFHVDDRKGFYYCFGCHAKGDALGFVRETENLGFMEAVKLLASEAGMPVPASDPRAAEREAKRNTLVDVMEAAVQHYKLNLKTAAATETRAYLEQRGLTSEIIEHFEIGFAPNSNTLSEHLKSKGFEEAKIIEAGLSIKSDRGGAPYDRFRGRIIFPIRDQRGRAIAFGGRAIDPDARAKYLNSPETPLFDKGRSLYNFGPARAAAGKAGALVVAEGYMDVIALHQAGFTHAVAPLGTAITPEQLQLMWRAHPEPVITLDGDTAGLRAAMRLIDVALPLIEPGKSLRFAIMPEGLDPDDLIKSAGAPAMQALLDAARPMVDLLWQRETEGQVFDSPERKALLDKTLRMLLGKITDPSIKSHYGQEIKNRRQSLFYPQQSRKSGFTPWRKNAPLAPLPDTKNSLLASANTGPEAEARVRESAILLGCLHHPELAEKLESRLDRLPYLCPDLRQIGHALLAALPLKEGEGFNDLLSRRFGFDVAEKLLSIRQVASNPHLRANADKSLAERALSADIDRQFAIVGIIEETSDARIEIDSDPDEGLTWRLEQAREAKYIVEREAFSDSEDSGDESHLSQKLQDYLDGKL